MKTLTVSVEKTYARDVDSAPFGLHVNFETRDELTVLFGPSGAGKTLTLDCIAGFANPDKGNIRLGDEVLFDTKTRKNLAVRKRRIGYVFQKDALFPHMTLRGNLEFALRTKSPKTGSNLAEETLHQFGLGPLAGRRPDQVSGGERQRCSIARLLVSRPHLVLLDEPTRGLDVSLREQLYEVLTRVRSQYRLPMILVTHDLEEAFSLGDRMLVYDQGRIIQDGSPAGIHAGPTSPAVARLLGITPILRGTAVEHNGSDVATIESQGFRFPVVHLNGFHSGQSLSFCIRTEHVVARPAGTIRSSDVLTLPLQKKTEMPTHVRLEFQDGIAAELPRQELAVESTKIGAQWELQFPTGSVWVFPQSRFSGEK
jgi:molybdate transport system ATP-binding protein